MQWWLIIPHHLVTAGSILLNNTIFLGVLDEFGETLSSRSYRRQGDWPFSVTYRLINASFPDADHCDWAAIDWRRKQIWDVGRFGDRVNQNLQAELKAVGLL